MAATRWRQPRWLRSPISRRLRRLRRRERLNQPRHELRRQSQPVRCHHAPRTRRSQSQLAHRAGQPHLRRCRLRNRPTPHNRLQPSRHHHRPRQPALRSRQLRRQPCQLSPLRLRRRRPLHHQRRQRQLNRQRPWIQNQRPRRPRSRSKTRPRRSSQRPSRSRRRTLRPVANHARLRRRKDRNG